MGPIAEGDLQTWVDAAPGEEEKRRQEFEKWAEMARGEVPDYKAEDEWERWPNGLWEEDQGEEQ